MEVVVMEFCGVLKPSEKDHVLNDKIVGTCKQVKLV